jgi:hypothetical protein
MLTLKPHRKLTFDPDTKTHTLGICIEDAENPVQSFDQASELSSRVLEQLIKDHFRFKYCQKHKGEPFIKLLENSRTANDMLYDVDDTLSKNFVLFVEGLIPDHSTVVFKVGSFRQEYIYLGRDGNTLRFQQRFYAKDDDPVAIVEIKALVKDLVPLTSVDNGFLAYYLNERCEREPEMAEAYLRELEDL